MMRTLWAKMRTLVEVLWREVAKFGVVGAVAWVIDTAVFLWLIKGPMDDAEVWAKGWATVVASIFSWAANRWWTFRHRRNNRWVRELVLFAVMNAIGLLIAAGCVFFTKYVLQMTSPMALFVAGSVVGLILGTIFRFIAYRLWVFNESKGSKHEDRREVTR